MNQEKTTLDLKVEQKYGSIVHKFRILHYGWEIDNDGYVVNVGGKNIFITTNHGRLIEMDLRYLFDKINEYEDLIKETKEAIKFLQNGKN
jgi:hypothetical protein